MWCSTSSRIVCLFFVAWLESRQESTANEDETLRLAQVSSLFLIEFIYHFLRDDITTGVEIDVFPMGNFRFQVHFPLRTTQLHDEATKRRWLLKEKGDTVTVKIETADGDEILFIEFAVSPWRDTLRYVKRKPGTYSPLSKHLSPGVREDLVDKLVEPGVIKGIRSAHRLSSHGMLSHQRYGRLTRLEGVTFAKVTRARPMVH